MKNKDNEQNNKISRGKDRNFPPTKIERGEDVLRAVQEAGGKIDTHALESALNTKGGALARKISSARRWNLVQGSGIITPTDLGKKILHPLSEEELNQTRRKSFLEIPLFSELYSRFGNKLPDNKTFIAILVREYELKENDAKLVYNIYKDSINKFLESTKEIENQEESLSSIPERTNAQKIIVKISSSIGENIFYASNKTEFEKLKTKVENIGNLIDWPEELKKEGENESQKS